jgi:hypothetical protein
MPKLNTADGAEWLRQVLAVHQPKLFVIDTVVRVVESAENDAPTWTAFYDHAGIVLKDAGVAMIRLDHEGWTAGRFRGNSAKADDVDAIWSMSKVGETGRRLTNNGDRSGFLPATFTVERLDSPPWGYRRVGSAASVGVSAAVVAKAADLDAVGLPLSTSRRQARKALESAGFTPGSDAQIAAAIKYRLAGGDGQPPEGLEDF